MTKKILYIITAFVLFETIGYFTFAQSELISHIISQRELVLHSTAFKSIEVNTNTFLTQAHKQHLSMLFKKKKIIYRQFSNLEDLHPDTFFQKDKFSFTIEKTNYTFPTTTVIIHETTEGFGAFDETLYLWVFLKWVKLKDLSSGIS